MGTFKLMRQTTFITDGEGNKISAVLPMKAYKLILEELQELEDIRAYDRAKRKKEKPIPLKDAINGRNAQ